MVLGITGAEALYADMGHFGRRPIRIAWSGLVLAAPAPNPGAVPAELGRRFWRVVLHVGFMESPVVPQAQGPTGRSPRIPTR